MARSTAPAAKVPVDHRVEVAARKRAAMRSRLIEATLHVYAHASHRIPVIEDVVNEADVSRGTFYQHFLSLEEALQAVAESLSDQMTTDIQPVYGILKAPWQRFSVGFRLFLMRAAEDATWARFVTRPSATSHQLLVTDYMSADLRSGRDTGVFSFEDLDVAVDFMMGASLSGIRSLGQGVKKPAAYIEASVRMALEGLGCSRVHVERGATYSRDYLDGWKMTGAGAAAGRSAA